MQQLLCKLILLLVVIITEKGIDGAQVFDELLHRSVEDIHILFW